MSPKKPPAPAVPEAPFHSPFRGLQALRGALPEGKVQPKADSTAKAKPAPPRAVVRLERKGRRGKEVTVVEQLALSATEREAWLKELRHTLGCGGVEEEGALVLQGDHRQRVGAYLRARGVARVSVG